jgi:hypothetical protein
MDVIGGTIDLTTAEVVTSLPVTSLTTGRLVVLSGVYYYYAGGWIAISADAGSSSSLIPTSTILGNVKTTGALQVKDSLTVDENLQVDGQLYATRNAIGNSGATKTIDWNDGNVQTITLTADCTLTFSNPKAGARYDLLITQAATAKAITWPTIKWVGGVAPTLTATAAAKDLVTLLYDGTSYYGTYSQAFA